MESKPQYRVLAHVRWLSFPYAGRAYYIVKCEEGYGYIPATESAMVSGDLIKADDPNALRKAFEVRESNESTVSDNINA